MNIGHCQEWLSRHAQQFRSIQKRLLSRFKDKTPVGLAHLDTLLDGTYMQVCVCSGERGEHVCVVDVCKSMEANYSMQVHAT